jgi:hypothetical protein
MPWPSAVVKSAMSSQQLGVAARAHRGKAEFALVAAFDLAAQLVRHGLHAVADAQHRHAELEHRLRRLVGRVLVDAGVAAGEDHALELPSFAYSRTQSS